MVYQEMSVESRDTFTFAACCALLARLDPKTPELLAHVTSARDPDCLVTCLAVSATPQHVLHGNAGVVYYVKKSAPLPTDTKPEACRRLVLGATSRDTLTDFVYTALDAHRKLVTERRASGRVGSGIATYAWDEDAGGWVRGKPRACRPLTTLYLPADAEKDVLSDVRGFYADAGTLAEKLHVAPVRTYLLHGTPGSGKTSLVHCLASELGHGLAMLTFRPGMTDADVAAALARMPPRCLLLVEDIDCAFAGRTARNHGVSFASVLAALDGAWTDAPQAVFLTTNHLADLDPALRRRVDHVLEFGPATRQQARRLVEAFCPGTSSLNDFEALWHVCAGSSMSVLQKYLVKVRQDPRYTDRLDVLRDLAQCAAGAGADASAAAGMYG